MERGFAAAGSAPAAADTPAEVLARATGAGLVRSEPAESADRPVPPGQVQHPADDQRRLPDRRPRTALAQMRAADLAPREPDS